MTAAHPFASPLAWPGWARTQTRKPGKFSAAARGHGQTYVSYRSVSIAEAAQRVLDELRRLKAEDVILSTDLKLRRDGLPYSEQPEAKDPGAAVYWTRGNARQVIAIDTYTRTADNLAAIAATLEAMRAIERHGGALLDRAFTGFVALPAPSSCWEILGLSPTSNVDDIAAAFRRLAQLHHPDREGGSHARMSEIAAARDEAMRQVVA